MLAGCPAQVCSECGAPWERVTDSETTEPGYRQGNKPIRHMASSDAGQGQTNLTKSSLGMVQKVTTLGWRPACTCNAGTIPGTVADFFTGSGTTGAVACRLGRNFIGTELSPEYAEMAERRIAPHRDQMQLAVTT